MGEGFISSIALCVSISSLVVSIVSLIRLFYLDYASKISRVSGVIMWGAGSNFQPIIIVQNTGNTVAVIDDIVVKYNNSKVFSVSFLNDRSISEYAIIPAGEIKKIPITIDEYKTTQSNLKKKLEVIIRLTNGKKAVSEQYYTPAKFEELIFCNELFKE
ncbi:MAG: hypothetical protein II049_08680 [Clostridia bacterium]|nr:hypothetical protein [Clostridia bacterium]